MTPLVWLRPLATTEFHAVSSLIAINRCRVYCGETLSLDNVETGTPEDAERCLLCDIGANRQPVHERFDLCELELEAFGDEEKTAEYPAEMELPR